MQGLQKTIVWTVSLGLLLSGCAGGGGGASIPIIPPVATQPPPPPPVTPVPSPPTGSSFTSWASAPSPGSYLLTGVGATTGQTGFYTFKLGPWGPVHLGDQEVVLRFDAGGELNEAYVLQSQKTVFAAQPPTWAPPTRHSETFALGVGSLVTKELSYGDNDTLPVTNFTYADPVSIGLSYQTFGWWSAAQWSAPDQYGSFSVGAPTASSAVPTSGTAQFAGGLSAYVVDNVVSSVAAPVTINVDFGGRSAAFSSANFRDAQGIIYPGTALSGVLTYGSQTNALTGQLTSTAYSGPANGQFYGPAAQEIGGAFVLSPNDPSATSRVVGGFGAKR